MDIKQSRQQAIAQLIGSARYSDQLALVGALKNEYGISSTQAMVSRDLKELQVIKKIEEGRRCYALPNQEVEKEILRRGVRQISHNHSLIVVHTLPGLADFVGDQIDNSSLPVLGCIAGENTLFVAPLDVKKIDELMVQLKDYLCLIPN